MKTTRKYYVALANPAGDGSILGSGWSRDEALADAERNGANESHYVLSVPAWLSARIEREGDTPKLACLCHARGANAEA